MNRLLNTGLAAALTATTLLTACASDLTEDLADEPVASAADRLQYRTSPPVYHGWQQYDGLPGGARDIAGTSYGAWALDNSVFGLAGDVWVNNGIGTSWRQKALPQFTSAVAIATNADGDPWVVDLGGNLWKFVQQHNAQDPGHWESLDGPPGGAQDIAIDVANQVWVIGREFGQDGNIYHYVYDGRNWTWKQVQGVGSKIAVGWDRRYNESTVYVVNSQNKISELDGGWRSLPGGARDIGVGPDGSIFTTGTNIPNANDGSIYWWNNAANDWTVFEGAAKRISVGNRGYPWVVNSYGTVFRMY